MIACVIIDYLWREKFRYCWPPNIFSFTVLYTLGRGGISWDFECLPPFLNLGLDHHCCTGIFPPRIQFVASRIVWPCPQLYYILPGLYVSSSSLLLYSLSPVYFLVPDWFFLSIDWIDRILTLFSSNAKTFETWSRHFFGDLYFLLFFMKM